MNNSALPYWLALIVLLGAGYGGWTWWQVEQFQSSHEVGGLEFEGPPLEEFELTERSGKPFRSGDMLGRVWVTTFFFATCPGTCPRLNANIKHLNSLEELKDVIWVSITVDPDTDTLPKLREYADRFSADPERWLFCRGEFNYVRRVGKEFLKVDVSWRGHADYAVVIDRQGNIRGMYDVGRTSQIEKLRVLLLKCLKEDDAPSTVETVEDSQQEQSAA
jgi:protein SCO1/2